MTGILTSIRKTLSGEATLDELLDTKLIATTITSALLGWIVLFAAKHGVVIDVDGLSLLTVIVGPLVFSAVQFVVGWFKGDRRVENLLDYYRRSGAEPPEPAELTEPEPTA